MVFSLIADSEAACHADSLMKSWVLKDLTDVSKQDDEVVGPISGSLDLSKRKLDVINPLKVLVPRISFVPSTSRMLVDHT